MKFVVSVEEYGDIYLHKDEDILNLLLSDEEGAVLAEFALNPNEVYELERAIRLAKGEEITTTPLPYYPPGVRDAATTRPLTGY